LITNSSSGKAELQYPDASIYTVYIHFLCARLPLLQQYYCRGDPYAEDL